MYARRTLGSLVVVSVLFASCGGGGSSPTSPATPYVPAGTPAGTPATPAAPGSNEVIATTGSVFNPTSLTVAKGTTVTFTFQSVEHNVVFDAVAGAPAGIGNTASSAVQRVFATSGAFGFQCTIHGGMRGTVTVN